VQSELTKSYMRDGTPRHGGVTMRTPWWRVERAVAVVQSI